MQPRIVIAGAGVVGASIGAELAEAGADVTVIDAGRPGRGTSSATFAWINASADKEPTAYHELNVAAMDAHRRLAQRTRPATWYHPAANLQWADAADDLERLTKKVERRRELDYPVEWVSRRRLADLEPDLDPGDVADDRIARFPEEGWIDTPVLVATQLQRLRAVGGHLLTGTAVEALEVDAGVVTGVVAGADRLPVDVVLNCAGPEADRIATLAGVELPLRTSAGLIVTTGPAVTSLASVVHAPRLHLRPEGGGRLMLASAAADAGVQAGYTVARDVVAELLADAARLLPAAGDLDAEDVRVGVRPLPPDGLPMLGPTGGVDNLYHVVTHSGVLLSVRLGELVTRHLLSGEEPPDFGLYRIDDPARFAPSPTAT